ncbi:MAG: DUF4249 family protein [Bacteroidia bacterium]|nr:DUF4249 family protein [Bacteroidia bacterium]
MKKSIISFIACAFAAVSCVYPYDAEIGGGSDDLVIEGDIFIGSVSEFEVSTLMPVSSPKFSEEVVEHPDSHVWVENSEGEVFEGLNNGEGIYKVDLSDADPSLEYRLRVDVTGGRSYGSSWMASAGVCYADSLSYNLSETKDALTIMLSMHSDATSNRHFRYRYTEDWQYHAMHDAALYYEPPTSYWRGGTGTISSYFVDGKVNNYYCWDKDKARGINLATTEDLQGTALVDYPVMTFTDRTDTRFCYIYRIKLEIYPVEEDSYDYFEHVKELYSYTGSLFAPTPSEVRGNIRCLTDEDEMVYGYVAVSQPASFEKYIYGSDLHFYQDADAAFWDDQVFIESTWYDAYQQNWLPIYNETGIGMHWAPSRCIDCRLKGGTKDRPEDWITNDR